MSYQCEFIFAVLKSIEIPADVQVILDTANHKSEGSVKINDDYSAPALWFHWNNSHLEPTGGYNPFDDWMRSLGDEEYAYLELGDNDTRENDGCLERFGLEELIVISSPWSEIWDRQDRAEKLWSEQITNPKECGFRTEVKVEFFKTNGSGKSYMTETYFSTIECWNAPEITEEARRRFKAANEFHITVEMWQVYGQAWNKYLKLWEPMSLFEKQGIGRALRKGQSEGTIIDHIGLVNSEKKIPFVTSIKDRIEQLNTLYPNKFQQTDNFENDMLANNELQNSKALPYYQQPGNILFKLLFTEIEDYFQDFELADGATIMQQNGSLEQVSDKKVIKRFDLTAAEMPTLLVLLNDIESDLWRIVNEPLLTEDEKDQLIDNADHKYTVLLKRYAK